MKYLIIAAFGALLALTIASITCGWMSSGADIALLSLWGCGGVVAVAVVFLGEIFGHDTHGTSGMLGVMLLYIVTITLVAVGGAIVVFTTSALETTLWWCGGMMIGLSFLYLLFRK